MKKLRIGDVLIQNKKITEHELQQAIQQKLPDELLGESLVRLGFVTELNIMQALETSTGIERIALQGQPIESEVLKIVPEDFCRSHSIIPIRIENKSIIYVTNDPLDFTTEEELRFITGLRPRPRLATKGEILAQIEKQYGFTKMLHQLGIETEKSEEKQIAEVVDYSDTPMIQLVNQIITAAVMQGASDIHLDPSDEELIVRYRIDGILDIAKTFPKAVQQQMISRVKVMADMDITENRKPQDGRILLHTNEDVIDLRVSSLPTVKGEKIVLRILDITEFAKDIKKLGMDEDEEKKLRRLISKPNGIVLVSGPTGSGKTTTLYASLNELNKPDVNIITVEDPVEIKTQGVNQVQVNPDIDVSFANALRSILRQDPDIIMIGEIRDTETAEIAVRASLTGHLVLSTIHTNDAVRTITRLMDMDIQPYLLASSINGIIAQRLVRKLCPECRSPQPINETEKEMIHKHNTSIETIYHPKGCPACGNKGYIGRTGVYEILEFDDTLREMISNRNSMIEITKYATQMGMKPLLHIGLEKVKNGITSLEELLTVAAD